MKLDDHVLKVEIEETGTPEEGSEVDASISSSSRERFVFQIVEDTLIRMV